MSILDQNRQKKNSLKECVLLSKNTLLQTELLSQYLSILY